MFYKKIRKQALAAFVAASCAIAALPVMAQSSAETVFYEPFSGYEKYSKVFAYGEDINGADTLESDEYKNFTSSYGIGQALGINSEKRIPFGDNGRFYFYPAENAASMGASCFSITEFDVYIEKHASGKYELFLASTKDPGNHFAMLKFDGKEVSVTFYSDVVKTAELEDGAWHHFSVVMRITDEEAAAKAVLSQVSIDGQVVYEGSAELGRETYKTKSQYYDMIRIVNRSGIPHGYIDNITVKRVNSENPAQYIQEGAALLKAVRKSGNLLAKYSFLQGTYSYDALKSAYDEALDAQKSASASEREEYTALLDTLCEAIADSREAYSLSDLTFSDTRTISSLSVKNAALSEKSGAIILAFYENEVLKSSHTIKDVKLPTGETQIPLSEAVSYGEEVTDAVIYFWESMETLVPLRERININDYTVRSDIDITFNDVHYHTDTDAVLMADGTVFVPAENIFNLIGATLGKNGDTYRAERMNGEYLEFSPGEKITGKAPYLLENGTVMMDIADIADAFNISYSLDKENAMLTIESSYEESFDVSSLADSYTFSATYVGNESLLFTITPPELLGGTVEEVYIRINEAHKSDIFQTETDYGRSSGWSMPMESVLLWKKAYSVTKSGDSYTGSFSGIRTNGKVYDVMFKVNTITGTKYIIKEKAVTIPSASPELEDVKYDASSLLLKSTFENISYYKEAEKAAESKLYYKKSSDSDYTEGYTPVYEENIGQYLGTVANLEPNTSYDIKLVLDGAEETSSITTWNENPSYEEVALSDLYSGSGTLVLEGLKGTSDKWIKITGNTDIEAPDSFEAVYISDCEYLILEGITVKGGQKYAVHITGNSKDVRIRNCDISGWGRSGIWSDDTHTYRLNFDSVNYDGGVFVADAQNVVIERCYIHDSAARTNTWSTDEYTQVHPTGSTAIAAHTQNGLVVRYNDLIGNSYSRWNDAIEGAHNSSYKAGVGFDADIYGNMFFGGNDDAMELDGGSMNVRVFGNRIEQFYCGISLAPIKIGPAYVYNNLVYNLGDGYGSGYLPVKQGDGTVSVGKQFLFGNTFIAEHNTRALSTTTAINNIFISDSSNYPISVARSGDYNFYYGKSSSGFTYGDNDIYLRLPLFKDYLKGDFSLTDESPAKGSGTAVNNFTKSDNPDMGAYGDNAFLPGRPVSMSADRYHARMTDKGEATVTFTAGDMEDGLSFNIEKSAREEWLTVSGDLSGEVKSGESYTITLSADMDKMKTDKNLRSDSFSCAVLFRLSNGYSIPVTVNCER